MIRFGETEACRVETELRWVVASDSLAGSWDPDSSRIAWGERTLPYHTINLANEPLTSPRIVADADGIRYPRAHEPQPRLALRWEGNVDASEWTLSLRPGVRSRFGNLLSAEAVVWSWQRTYALGGVGVWRSGRVGGMDSPDGIEAVDERTLRFRLDRPNPSWPQYLSFVTNAIVDSTEARRHATADDPWAKSFLSAAPAGFGPFAPTGDGRTTFEARGDHWAGSLPIRSVALLGADSRERGLRMLETGEANFAAGLYPEELPRFVGRPEFHSLQTRANHSTLEFNWLEPPFDDQRVRQAVCFALPYGRILEDVYLGHARQSRSPVPSICEHHAGGHWAYETDLARAKSLLAQSPYRAGFDTAVYLQPSRESIRFAELLRDALLPLGIRVEARLQTALPPGTRVPMWFKEECGHGLFDAMYSLSHDYDPPGSMWGGKAIQHPRWLDRLAAIRSAPAEHKPGLLDALQRDLVDFAPCAHIAETQMGWVWRRGLPEWVVDGSFLGAATTMWGARWHILGWL